MPFPLTSQQARAAGKRSAEVRKPDSAWGRRMWAKLGAKSLHKHYREQARKWVQKGPEGDAARAFARRRRQYNAQLQPPREGGT